MLQARNDRSWADVVRGLDADGARTRDLAVAKGQARPAATRNEDDITVIAGVAQALATLGPATWPRGRATMRATTCSSASASAASCVSACGTGSAASASLTRRRAPLSASRSS